MTDETIPKPEKQNPSPDRWIREILKEATRNNFRSRGRVTFNHLDNLSPEQLQAILDYLDRQEEERGERGQLSPGLFDD